MDKENFANMLAEKHWPTLVVKHTVDGACNFQRAANELAALVAEAEREACAKVAEIGICESEPGPYNNACRNIAATIRAR